MRTKKIALLLLSLFFMACSSLKHLEPESEFGTTAHGSYIELWVSNGDKSVKIIERKGELIAIDEDSIYALVYQDEADTLCMGIPREKVNSFNLYHAKPNTSYWTIPAFALMSASHGRFALATAPLNLFTTSLIQNYILRKSRSQENDLNLDELSPYARFPRGLPPGLQARDIR